MMKPQTRRWSERRRMLLLMLAIILPGAALISFGVFHLRTIQRDKAIEAAIQRDYQDVLHIAEKRINRRAYEMAEEARADFPDRDSSDKLDDFLAKHADVAHAFIWSGKGNIEFRSQGSRMNDRQFCADSRSIAADLGPWMDIDAPVCATGLPRRGDD